MESPLIEIRHTKEEYFVNPIYSSVNDRIVDRVYSFTRGGGGMSSVMEYNGYHAKVEFDNQDKIFVGTVMGLNDTLAFHGKSVNELEVSFRNCIEDYLDLCREIGKQPEKEFKGAFNIRISPDSYREAAMDAAIDGITLNQFVAEAIDEKIKRKREMAVNY